MDEKEIRLGFHSLVDAVGREFYLSHKENAVFSYGEEDEGIYCFLGITLHPERSRCTLSASLDDWDIYASCYVINGLVKMDECKLP